MAASTPRARKGSYFPCVATGGPDGPRRAHGRQATRMSTEAGLRAGRPGL